MVIRAPRAQGTFFGQSCSFGWSSRFHVVHSTKEIWHMVHDYRYNYRIYSNKRRSTHLTFSTRSAALIRGRRLFKHCTRQIYFFYIFIQRYTFYQLIFLRNDTKLIVNLKLREKFTRFKNPESFMITRAKISEVRASRVRRLFEQIR